MSDPANRSRPLTTGWRLQKSAPSEFTTVANLDWANASENAVVPGTVASTLIGQFTPTTTLDIDFDKFDWWYQCDFRHEPDGEYAELVFDGLATIAEVWLNDEPILESQNMFRCYRVDVSRLLRATNTLTIVFRSVDKALSLKRARPGWKTRLVSNQQLRWLRTTLLGRIPGWTPPISPVGPWRGIRLDSGAQIRSPGLQIVPSVVDSLPKVAIRGPLHGVDPAATTCNVILTVGDADYELPCTAFDGGCDIDCEIPIDAVSLWSPDAPELHRYAIRAEIGDSVIELQNGQLGFREVIVDRESDRLQFRINGEAIFCRGACWTTNDIVSLDGDPQDLRACLERFRSAGGNMIRVGGTMVYESDAFYGYCDEMGIMVWQDFMFANMDYPASDDAFLAEARAEIDEQSRRLASHACVVAFCGNSEVEQQAAMFGRTPDLWRNALFYEHIPEILGRNGAQIAYFPSSPSEGALPFHVATGVSHYFGVGAYKQPIASVDSARVKFTTECLAFSNVPSDRALIDYFATAAPPVHHPDWKAGVPRDSGAGWDFEDIRDHYVAELYGIDPVALRYADKERYIAIAQVASGEVIERVFDSWRGTDSDCSGALIWQLKDIVPGAGWGFLDAAGRPKPLYFFLRRCWSDLNLALLDRGLDGLVARIINDTYCQRNLRIDIKLLQHSKTLIGEASEEFVSRPRSVTEFSFDELLGQFYDVGYRYRFGAPKHDVVVATLLDEDGRQLQARAFFPNGHDIHPLESAEVEVSCSAEDGTIRIDVHSQVFLQHVKLHSRTHDFDDNHFHLSPKVTKTIIARPIEDSPRPFRAVLGALNLRNPVSFS